MLFSQQKSVSDNPKLLNNVYKTNVQWQSKTNQCNVSEIYQVSPDDG